MKYVRGAPGRLIAENRQPEGRALQKPPCHGKTTTAFEAEGKATLRAGAWLRSSGGSVNADIHIAL